MSLRLVQVFTSDAEVEAIREAVGGFEALNVWREQLSLGRSLVYVLLPADQVEPLLDILDRRFSKVPEFRVMLLPVEAALPRAVTEPPKDENGATRKAKGRISRAELHSDIAATVELKTPFVVMVVLSSVVAAIGLIRDNTAVTIGAMVIAPLLGPNVALALATALADFDLGRKALRKLAVGLTVALILTAFMGAVVPFNADCKEIAMRTVVHYSDIILALAAGAAGTLAFTTGAPAALIGVMVAVALLPPGVTFGLMIGAGEWQKAGGACLLLVTNLICVNLAGVLTFILQGVRPRQWWEADRARRATRTALAIWGGLLVVLLVLIYVASHH